MQYICVISAIIMSILKYFIQILLGASCCIALVIFLILSIPVYIFRLVVILLARRYRPDLDEIFNSQSSVFLSDYFSKTPPRSNVVCTTVFEGPVLYEEFKNIVLKRWIQARNSSGNGELIYKKFQQYPVTWMGFGFWKNALDTFNIDNHVHKLFGKEIEICEEQMQEKFEILLNTHVPRQQSPWEIYIVENYRHFQTNNSIKEIIHSTTLIILRYHHCLADGLSIIRATADGIFQDLKAGKGAESAHKLPSVTPASPLTLVAKPVQLLNELCYALSQNFRYSPWKISDNKKDWYQIFVKADPMPIQIIKDIKNEFGVSFTSVLLSAISAAIEKWELDKQYLDENFKISDSIFCASSLPIRNRSRDELLTNSVTAALFDLPVGNFKSEIDRLMAVHCVLEKTKRSVIPAMGLLYVSVLGRHCFPVVRLFSKNKMIPISVTNVPTYPCKTSLNGKAFLDADFIMGGFAGDAGAVISMLSYDQHIRIGITAERGLMPRNEAKQFVANISKEILKLHTLASKRRF